MAETTQTREVDLAQSVEAWVRQNIDEKGVYPSPGFVLKQDDTLEIAALDLNPDQCMLWAFRAIVRGAKQVALGLDRYCKEGQGTILGDLVAVYHYRLETDSWRVGVIEYQHAPRLVKPICWNNAFWHKTMKDELEMVLIRGVAQKVDPAE